MKARVKVNGNIISVIPKQYDGYVGYVEPSTGYYYDSENLEIISFENDFEPNYWERLKHQYAGMIVQGMVEHNGINFLNDAILNVAAQKATALVEKLKNNNQ